MLLGVINRNTYIYSFLFFSTTKTETKTKEKNNSKISHKPKITILSLRSEVVNQLHPLEATTLKRISTYTKVFGVLLQKI